MLSKVFLNTFTTFASIRKILIFQVSVLPVSVRSGMVLPEDKQAGKLEAGVRARLQVRVFEGWSRAPQE